MLIFEDFTEMKPLILWHIGVSLDLQEPSDAS